MSNLKFKPILAKILGILAKQVQPIIKMVGRDALHVFLGGLRNDRNLNYKHLDPSTLMPTISGSLSLPGGSLIR